MLQSSVETLYAVARKNKIISDGYTDVDTAKHQLRHIAETMESVGLDPDVHVVTVEVEHTVGKHTAYHEPTEDDEPAVTSPADLPPAE